MTIVKSLLLKVGIILLSVGLFAFIGYLEAFGVKRISFCGTPPPYSYFEKQGIVYASNNVVRVWIESGYEEKSTIEIGARLGHRKRFSKSEDIPMILLLFIGVWGSAIIFCFRSNTLFHRD